MGNEGGRCGLVGGGQPIAIALRLSSTQIIPLGEGRMRLDSFSVENYRSITQARRISLTENTVLVGPNNEGKSNILRALSAAMYALVRHPYGGTRAVGDGARARGPERDKFYK